MTSYSVQYSLPVDNPVNKVSVCKGKSNWEFLVPINHPDAHNMGFMDLCAAQELSGLFHLCTGLKNRSSLKKSDTSKATEALNQLRKDAAGR